MLERLTGVRTLSATVDATPRQVWEVLSDGWLYPLWVVGASRMRDVDEGWPAVGSRLHHSVGTWPMVLDDVTEVLEAAPARRLVLRARAWPGGAARVTLDLVARDEGCEVRMTEDAIDGPGVLVPRPVRQAAIVPRNREALTRLTLLVAGRTTRRR